MTDLPEPDDLTGLYWPEDDDESAVILVRDDRAAAGIDHDDGETDAHWFAPNAAVSPMTWAELSAQISDETNRVPLADAIAFTIPDRFTTTNGDTP